MPTGASPLYYPEQAEPRCPLELEDSYFLVRLHEAQAFFDPGWLNKPGYLIFSSAAESTFQPGLKMQSLHQISVLQKNVPCRLGLSVNLTDWLPARSADTLHFNLKYSVIQDTPFKDFLDQVGKLGLIAKVSTMRPELSVALKVSEVVGRLLSISLHEGSQHEIFPLNVDLNLVDLKAGYYASIGSHKDEEWADTLRIKVEGHNVKLTNSRGHQLMSHSYALFQVIALKRLGEEIAREKAWWELLQAGKDQALDSYPISDQEMRRVLDDWRITLSQVRKLAIKEHGCLLTEIQEIIRKAQVEVQEALLPKTKEEAFGVGELPDAWQKLLGVRTEDELRRSAQDYQDALDVSRKLVEQYKSLGDL